MKSTILIVCKKKLTREDVSTLVRNQGGSIYYDRSGIGQVDANKSTVWFFFDETEKEREVVLDTIGDEITERFGGEYGSSITLEASQNSESKFLIQEIAIACCVAWKPAFVYDWSEAVFTLDEMILLRDQGRTLLGIDHKTMNAIGIGKIL